MIFAFYGPWKPHLGHLYGLPNLRHFPSRLIWISPQLGQRNFVDSLPGGIGLPQLVHVTKDRVDLSVISLTFCSVNNVRVTYICCAQKVALRCVCIGGRVNRLLAGVSSHRFYFLTFSAGSI